MIKRAIILTIVSFLPYQIVLALSILSIGYNGGIMAVALYCLVSSGLIYLVLKLADRFQGAKPTTLIAAVIGGFLPAISILLLDTFSKVGAAMTASDKDSAFAYLIIWLSYTLSWGLPFVIYFAIISKWPQTSFPTKPTA